MLWTIVLSVSVVVAIKVATCEPLPIEITGLGWHSPQAIFPSRYFFVWNKPVSAVVITSPADDRACRVWQQVFNETNFADKLVTIVRYKLVGDVCRGGIQIDVYGNDQSSSQPMARRVVTEDIWSEKCVCRRHDWPQLMKCREMSQQFKQIDSDLSIFNTSDGIDFDKVLDEMKSRFAEHRRSYSFCHYQVINNQAYKHCYGEYIGFAQFWDEMLRSLLSKTYIPDIEFVANLGDWPLSDKRTKPPLPVMSWCGSTDSNDIVLPTYELTESTLQMQGRVTLDVLSVFGKQSVKFDDKKEMLFWRGRDSNENRLKLIRLSKNHTSLINASLTNFFFFRDQMDELGPKSPYVSFFDFFQYKYQLNIDGTVAAYRLPYLLAGNSVVLKQESKYYEFFYHLLKPDVHYIAVDKELNNLVDNIDHLIKLNDSNNGSNNLWQLITESRQLVLDNLLPQHIYCYHMNFIDRYSSLLKNKIVLRPEMTKVFVDSDTDCHCDDQQQQQADQLRDRQEL
ncbi:protein O-glucosyltransferase 2-like [Oppia nitens]|uniref:protein O-glucosyltransferase 2-like n=1 Tax=Oppia nitens TaxID=1686743 RepID=UPI0023D99A8C|nr:protein O-glucosyltransferase 2-like [Oppia nitens]